MKSDFSKLKRKILTHVVLIVVTTLVLGILIKYALIDGILQAPFANGFLWLCQNVLRIDHYTAMNIYQQLFRNQKSFLLMIGLLILLSIVFYYALSRLTKYFDEVSAGINQLLDEDSGNIHLSPEMDFMETKLNTVKNTLEKRAKDAQEAEQRKNDLVVYLAHDIRTPLTSVIGYLNLLDEAPDMPMEQKAKYVKITLENALRLEQLINEFFDITRFNLQSILLNTSEVNLSYMLMQMADEFYPILAPQGKSAIVNADGEIIITADADKLARVFHNILKNAAAFSYDHTDIVISAKQEEDHIKITFTNKSNPIPEARLQTIFEKFYRLDDARSTSTGGAGLGLAIAKEIITAHDGSIFAESNELETTFTVILPSSVRDS